MKKVIPRTDWINGLLEDEDLIEEMGRNPEKFIVDYTFTEEGLALRVFEVTEREQCCRLGLINE